MLVNLAMAVEMTMVIGLSTFFQKYAHVQFNYTEGDASIVIGLLVVPGAAFGAFFGGYLINRYAWECKEILRFSVGLAFVSVFLTLILLVPCGTPDANDGAMYSTCHTKCNCDNTVYKPICALGKRISFSSPCQAGCSKIHSINGNYVNCSCFPEDVTSAVNGRCDNDCKLFPLFGVGVFLLMVFTYMNDVPMLTIPLRIVDVHQRSLALGVHQIILRFAGYVPGPIIFGAVIDATCTQWRSGKSKGTAECMVYNKNLLMYYVVACSFVLKLVSLFCMVWASGIYGAIPVCKSPNNEDECPIISNDSLQMAEDDR